MAKPVRTSTELSIKNVDLGHFEKGDKGNIAAKISYIPKDNETNYDSKNKLVYKFRGVMPFGINFSADKENIKKKYKDLTPEIKAKVKHHINFGYSEGEDADLTEEVKAMIKFQFALDELCQGRVVEDQALILKKASQGSWKQKDGTVKITPDNIGAGYFGSSSISIGKKDGKKKTYVKFTLMHPWNSDTKSWVVNKFNVTVYDLTEVDKGILREVKGISPYNIFTKIPPKSDITCVVEVQNMWVHDLGINLSAIVKQIYIHKYGQLSDFSAPIAIDGIDMSKLTKVEAGEDEDDEIAEEDEPEEGEPADPKKDTKTGVKKYTPGDSDKEDEKGDLSEGEKELPNVSEPGVNQGKKDKEPDPAEKVKKSVAGRKKK